MKKVIDGPKESKYKIGQKIRVAHWEGITEPLEILEINQEYHPRFKEWVYEYRMSGDSHLELKFIPEGYLRALEDI